MKINCSELSAKILTIKLGIAIMLTIKLGKGEKYG